MNPSREADGERNRPEQQVPLLRVEMFPRFAVEPADPVIVSILTPHQRRVVNVLVIEAKVSRRVTLIYRMIRSRPQAGHHEPAECCRVPIRTSLHRKVQPDAAYESSRSRSEDR
jgi:hypothetical protein